MNGRREIRTDQGALDELLRAEAVRERCDRVRQLAEDKGTRWFRIDARGMDACVEFVAEVCRRNYPGLRIPLHSRWRHFDVSGTNLWEHYLAERCPGLDLKARARTAIDLVFVSVLLDAGSGGRWSYREPITGALLARSEGLAAASLDLFFNGLALPHADGGFAVDAAALRALTADHLNRTFQHTESNPLSGEETRLRLLHALADVLEQTPAGGKQARPSDIIESLVGQASDGVITAADVLHVVLTRFGEIWPNGLRWAGRNLGDCGVHSQLGTAGSADAIVPFHKLSQWLSYSLVEPLHWSGLRVIELDGLTGLPEYRNGGLLIDTGVVVPTDEFDTQAVHEVSSEPIVEWRALTVSLLDSVAAGVRGSLGMTTSQLPLAAVLQGGTWDAGRIVARQRRGDTSPPLRLALDGTIF